VRLVLSLLKHGLGKLSFFVYGREVSKTFVVVDIHLCACQPVEAHRLVVERKSLHVFIQFIS
jgi:hypothetical protein